jgi:hypothetical protein
MNYAFTSSKRKAARNFGPARLSCSNKRRVELFFVFFLAVFLLVDGGDERVDLLALAEALGEADRRGRGRDRPRE